MSNPTERPWSEEEKKVLLTEILKKDGIPSRYLVKLICDLKINPAWSYIPLPPGRSLNSCQLAFGHMCQQHVQQPVLPRSAMIPAASQPQPPHPEPITPAVVRKRPCPGMERPIAPRPSTVPYDQGSSASITSPNMNEPPKKRGRPTKAEAERKRAEEERKKAAAEARGERYPLPKRRGSGKSKASTATVPNSPAGSLGATGTSFSPRTNVQGLEAFKAEPQIHHGPSAGQPLDRSAGFGGNEQRSRAMSDQILRPVSNTTSRELPRPMEARQTLPSPQELQLGHPEPMPRFNPSHPPLEHFHPDRIPRVFDAPRPMLADPARNRRPEYRIIAPAPTLDPATEKKSR
ncbi:putative AT DNA binding protein [Aspergillus ruber CBS 135680]|uniref:Uncharacterized protein n=1 Tax=Aspergillus ruber (strain CBS 135680) TaxID=1388766 RepID=A0A017SA06_ASPRC|nr:uncharacterized protein EURHEDRAFT_149064 [Aspergillus ruber CBS 135680]EYE93469.1 hypothetical protein EURHEDRAFT_149064 [Aspergillus ruber CBS 135680]